MKKLLPLSVILLMCSILATAQNNYFTVQPGQKIAEAIPNSAMYFLPRFERGFAALKDGKSGALVLNYNYLLEEMMFINDNGDTLSLASPQDFKYFVLAADTFYYNQFFVRNIAGFGNIHLVEREFFGTTDVKKMGATGVSTTSVGIDVIKKTEATDNFGARELVAREVTTLKKHRQYLVGDDENGFVYPTRKNLQKLYHRKSGLIKSYFDENKVDTNNPEDLKILLAAIQ